MLERLSGGHIEGVRNPITINKKEAQSTLHPLQQFAVEVDYVRAFFKACNTNAKQQMPFLLQKEKDCVDNKKVIKNRHVFGLYDAYNAKRQGKDGLDRFKLDWGEESDYLLSQVESFLPNLDAYRETILSQPEKIQPYDIKLAERRARRYRAGLSKSQKDLFSEMSGVAPDSVRKRLTELGIGVTAATSSMFAVDAAATAVGTPIEKTHINLLETTDMKILIPATIASYGPFIYSIFKSVQANMRLAKETGVSTNFGFSAGDLIAQSIGADDATSKIESFIGQGGFELAKDSIWLTGLGGLIAAGQLTVRDALIFVTFANLGAAGYEITVAKGVHKALDLRRKLYNKNHPFPAVENDLDTNSTEKASSLVSSKNPKNVEASNIIYSIGSTTMFGQNII